MTKEKKCVELVKPACRSRMEDIKIILSGDSAKCEEEGLPTNIGEYGLCIDFIESGTFTDQKEAYTRYQISWGGPSEEFRVFNDRVEFWYLDWYDGSYTTLWPDDEKIIRDIVDMAI